MRCIRGLRVWVLKGCYFLYIKRIHWPCNNIYIYIHIWSAQFRNNFLIGNFFWDIKCVNSNCTQIECLCNLTPPIQWGDRISVMHHGQVKKNMCLCLHVSRILGPVLTVERNELLTLSKRMATSAKRNKGTGNDYALPVSWMMLNCQEVSWESPKRRIQMPTPFQKAGRANFWPSRWVEEFHAQGSKSEFLAAELEKLRDYHYHQWKVCKSLSFLCPSFLVDER